MSGYGWDNPDADPLGDLLEARDRARREPWPRQQIVVPPAITEQAKRVYGPDWRDRFGDEWLFLERR